MNGANQSDARYVAARRVLLDALEARGTQRVAVILVGAQAIYLYAGELEDIAIPPFTEDADLALDPVAPTPDPKLLEVLRKAGFVPRVVEHGAGVQGVWEKQGTNTTVDFLVPEALAGRGGRSADLGPHGTHVARRARGLEAALVDQETRTIAALKPATDPRAFDVAVAGPAALLVAKLHNIQERVDADRAGKRLRAKPKDALDCYRLLRAASTPDLVDRFTRLGQDERSRQVADDALAYLHSLFASPASEGSGLLARAIAGLENVDETVASAVALAADLREAQR